jgi:hypothetical protein
LATNGHQILATLEETNMELKPGLRLYSQVCTTQVLVIRPGARTVELSCGGAPMVTTATSTGTPAAGLAGGNQIGKRYSAVADDTFEVLVVKPGAGTLCDGGEPLSAKQAKPLPASD